MNETNLYILGKVIPTEIWISPQIPAAILRKATLSETSLTWELHPGFWVQLTLAKGLFHLSRDCFLCKLHAFVSDGPWLCSPRRYLNETKITLLPGQNGAYLACALLFLPPMIPSCDVKAAVQHKAKRKRWPHFASVARTDGCSSGIQNALSGRAVHSMPGWPG